MKIIVFVTILHIVTGTTITTLIDVTKQVFSNDDALLGYLAALNDINNDRIPDVFVISGDGKSVNLLLGSNITPYLKKLDSGTIDAPDGQIITSIITGDFNSDGQVDLGLTVQPTSVSSTIEIIMYLGSGGKIDVSSEYKVPYTFSDQPLVVDANGDSNPDLFATLSNDTRLFLVGQTIKGNFSFAVHGFSLASPTMDIRKSKAPHSNAFIHMDGKISADLFVTAEDTNGKLVYEFWKGSRNGLAENLNLATEDVPEFNLKNSIIGMATFGDISASKEQVLLVPLCQNNGEKWCENASIIAYSGGKWHTVFMGEEAWAFPLPDDTKVPHTHITLHIGDFDLDSYADILMVLVDIVETPHRSKSVVLYNRPCHTDFCKGFGRQFQVGNVATSSDEVLLTSFYDFHGDGSLDVFVVAKNSADTLSMQVFENTIEGDVTFLMTQVITSVAGKDIYGSNVPGPLISYTTTNPQGYPQVESCAQSSQSAHLVLQLPYCIFGLGRLANFVDELTVALPMPLLPDLPTDYMPLNHTWRMLIPNSEMYVVPNPTNKPESWRNKVLVTPSRNVIMTAVVLFGTLAAVSMSIFVLHCIEKKEDKQEKIQEAYRFHFDAM